MHWDGAFRREGAASKAGYQFTFLLYCVRGIVLPNIPSGFGSLWILYVKKITYSVLYSQVQMFSEQILAWDISLLILLLDENSHGMFCSPIPKQIFLWKLRYILNTSWANYLFIAVMVSLKMALPAGQHNYAFNSFYQVVKITQMMNISIVRKSKAFNKLHWLENLTLPKMAMPTNLCK